MKPRRPQIVAISVLVLAVGALVWHTLQYAFVSDDAYISFRYAWNFAFHDQLTFNLGERVEGYTNFLWVMLLGLLLKLQLRPDVMSQVLGLLAGGAVLALLYALGRLYRGGRATPWELLAPALLPTMAGFAVWCSGGLETQLFTALALAGVTLYVAEHAGRVRWRCSGLLFALAAMTRPEGLLLFGLTGLHRLAANVLGERRLLPRWAEVLWVLGFVVPFGAFFAWRYSYYGYPFPNTYYVKAGGDGWHMLQKWGLPYLRDFIHDNKLYVLAPALLLWRPRPQLSPAGQASRGVRPAFLFSYLALLILPYTAYVCWVGGDFMALGRFYVPILPLVVFWLQEALRETLERPRIAPDSWRASRLVPVAVLLLGLSCYNSLGVYRANQKMRYYRGGIDTIAYLDRFAADRIKVGRWLRQQLPTDTYLAVGGAGAIVYASRLRALDTFGLNDLWIAHQGPRRGDRPGHAKFAPRSYILRQRPDLMCHEAKHQDWPYRPRRHDARYWRQRGYHWVCIDPPRLRPSHYCCLKRRERELGPWPAER